MTPIAAPFPLELTAPGTANADFAAVLSVDELPRGAMRRVTRGDLDVLLVHTPDGIVAVDDRCPHKGGRLSQGIVHGHAVTCPLHNWVIELGSGEAAAPDQGCVRRIPARVEDGRVLLDLGRPAR
jgi:nitrite reductase (NADH) small subunit